MVRVVAFGVVFDSGFGEVFELASGAVFCAVFEVALGGVAGVFGFWSHANINRVMVRRVAYFMDWLSLSEFGTICVEKSSKLYASKVAVDACRF